MVDMNPVPNDPNGYPWDGGWDWKAAGYDSYETFIESKAGACPWEVDRGWDWPMPQPPPFPADDEDDEVPDDQVDQNITNQPAVKCEISTCPYAAEKDDNRCKDHRYC